MARALRLEFEDALYHPCARGNRREQITRSLSVELSPPVLHESGLASALEWLATQTRKHDNVQVNVEADSSANPKAVGDGGCSNRTA